MVSKMELVAQLHESLLENVDQAQKKKKKTYVARKGCIIFHFFGDGEMSMKMRKLGKKKSMFISWERPYQFAGYKDGKGCQEQDEGAKICIIRDKDGQTW